MNPIKIKYRFEFKFDNFTISKLFIHKSCKFCNHDLKIFDNIQNSLINIS